MFVAPSTETIDTPTWHAGMYTAKNVTPYMHQLVYHIPEFLREHRAIGLNAFSCSALEKKNHLQVRQFFSQTSKGGFQKELEKSAIISILELENHSLYYRITDIPSIIKKPTV